MLCYQLDHILEGFFVFCFFSLCFLHIWLGYFLLFLVCRVSHVSPAGPNYSRSSCLSSCLLQQLDIRQSSDSVAPWERRPGGNLRGYRLERRFVPGTKWLVFSVHGNAIGVGWSIGARVPAMEVSQKRGGRRDSWWDCYWRWRYRYLGCGSVSWSTCLGDLSHPDCCSL